MGGDLSSTAGGGVRIQRQQPVVKVARRTEGGDAPGSRGATSENPADDLDDRWTPHCWGYDVVRDPTTSIHL